MKSLFHAFLSALLLFTAAIVSNIERVQQTLNLTLDAAYGHVFLPVEALIWIHSLAIVLLIVAHALRHVETVKSGRTASPVQANTSLQRLIMEFGQIDQPFGVSEPIQILPVA